MISSVQNKDFPVVRDNQNLWQTINIYWKVVKVNNQLLNSSQLIYSETVREDYFVYDAELSLHCLGN